MRRYALSAAILTAGAAAGAAWLAATVGTPETAATKADPVAGAALYQEYCASCHGADLEGQPDWQSPGSDGRLPAPPHDASGHTWHHPDSMLFDYVKLGGAEALARQGVTYDSGMPGFADQLSDMQIRNILAYIRSAWPEREREFQAARSAGEAGPGD
jgi:mono/diheme cytochrome c family protein